MRKGIVFSTGKDKTINKDLAKKYFISQEFILKSELEDTINFARGSYLLNMVTFDPLKWRSTITLTFEEDSINAIFNISTFGQTVSKKEEVLWDFFILNLEQSILEKKNFSLINEVSLNETKKHSFRLMGWTILGVVLFGVPSGILANYMQEDFIFFIGIAIGGGFFFNYFQNKK